MLSLYGPPPRGWPPVGSWQVGGLTVQLRAGGGGMKGQEMAVVAPEEISAGEGAQQQIKC